ncbi:MAG: FAD-binding oxidoreductase [Abditibacteriales bacterium]|nr:FAD-binding oxidoreductase [Abditibacteriales bacterium]MDW8364534.1 FAD-binding oxidoreductase [Abditibacteriales bacterium]
MSEPSSHPWGNPVWTSSVHVNSRPLPSGLRVNVAVIGAGFTGLATACYVLGLRPEWHVAVFEAETVGAGASGRTGGIVLEDTAVGPLPGVERCLETLQALVSSHQIECDLQINGCWEVGRREGRDDSPIAWEDQGTLRVVNVEPGGVVDPMKLVAGLARVVQESGGQIYERAPVTAVDVAPKSGVRLEVAGKTVFAERAVFATNASCLSLLGLHKWARGVHTLALATAPLPDALLSEIGWASRTPFYTVDLPYLWGRVTADGRMVMGSGIIGGDALENIRADGDEARRLFERLERRISGLHPALRRVRVTHRWMGPICFTGDSKPVLVSKNNDHLLMATGYGGHGVALSVRVGKLLAEVITGRNALPAWSYRLNA